jgi:hypothetical protein
MQCNVMEHTHVLLPNKDRLIKMQQPVWAAGQLIKASHSVNISLCIPCKKSITLTYNGEAFLSILVFQTWNY